MQQEWTKKAWAAHIDGLTERSKGIAALERGRFRLSSEELDIIYSWKLTTAEKWERVSAIREARAAKTARREVKRQASRPGAVVIPFRFEERVTDADVTRARGMGISIGLRPY